MDKRMDLADLEKENERLRQQLAELDEMPENKSSGKTPPDRKGMRDIATGASKRISSIPGQDDRYYLELYLLQKERGRLVKETRALKKQRLRVGQKISDIDKEIADKEEKALAGMTILSSKPTTNRTESHEKPVEGKTQGKERKASKRHGYKDEGWNTLTLEY